MSKIIILLLFLIVPQSLFCQSVTNVNAFRDGDSIIVEYNYEGDYSSKLYLWVSYDRGVTWDGPLKSALEDAGNSYSPKAKKIVWNVTADLDVLFGDNILFRVGSGSQNNDHFIDSRDGQTYQTVSIGNSIWMGENLNFETKKGSWKYFNDNTNWEKYGRLYEWQSAILACPLSWHLPSKSNWEELIKHCRGKNAAGLYLKSKTGWSEPKQAANNITNFSALPGGYFKKEDQFRDIGTKGLWWSTTENNASTSGYASSTALSIGMESGTGKVESSYNPKYYGLSVRCISDPVFYGESQPGSYAIIKPGCSISKIPFEPFVVNYVEDQIILWQTKGPSEKTSDYMFRVTEEKRNLKLLELAKVAGKKYMDEISKTIDWGELHLGLYNSANETFQIKSDIIGDFNMPIPINDVISFRQNWKNLKFLYADFFVNTDTLKIAGITISNPSNGRFYSYKSNEKPGLEEYNIIKKHYAFNEIPADTANQSKNLTADNRTTIDSNPVKTDPKNISGNLNETQLSQQSEMPTQSKVNDEDSGFGKFYALIIGVNTYEDEGIMDLDEPLNDASMLFDILTTNYTFDPENISRLANPKREDILVSLENLSRTVTKNDNLLIFYAGHGTWDEKIKTGYWLPADAKVQSTLNWFPNSTLRDYVAGIESKHTLVIADACFSGAIFKSRFVSTEEATANTITAKKLHNLPSRKAMTSGTLKAVPDKSIFMMYLIKRLQENELQYISSEEIFSRLRSAVINNSPSIPQYGEIMNAGDEGGDFIFIRRE